MTARFPIRFEAWYRVLSSALFLRPSESYVEVRDDVVEARMAWGFQARFRRSTVASTEPVSGLVLSRGVHGFAGRWLVNGSGDRILAIDVQPPQRARVLGVPVKLKRLMVSVDDPDALAKALTA